MIDTKAMETVSLDVFMQTDYDVVSLCSYESKQLTMKVHPIIKERIFTALFDGKSIYISNNLEEAMAAYNNL